MEKTRLRREAFAFLGSFDKKIRTKLDNISGKTGQYNVPDRLYQKRTNRKNRVLISWKTVIKNNLSLDELNTFSGGVVVEFVNEDFFEEDNQTNPLFLELKNRLGSNENVSSIITIRSESGSSSSFIQRKAFERLIDNLEVLYLNQLVTITPNNYKNYGIRQHTSGGSGNDKWDGFLFVSIKGGQQDIVESHLEDQTIFNPACEFANADVSCDLDLVMAFFALLSIDSNRLSPDDMAKLQFLKNEFYTTLTSIRYDNLSYSGNLLDYCVNHPSAKLVPGKLYDPIQVEEICIDDFAVDNKEDNRNLDFTHNEAVNKDVYYWDNEKKCILSAARPTNVFWSKHLSNMMQQNFTLDEYFRHEEEIISRRKALLAEHR